MAVFTLLCEHARAMSTAPSVASAVIDALPTVVYEFVVLLGFPLSWVAFRAQRVHQEERDAAKKKKLIFAGNDRFSRERGGDSPGRDAAAGPRSKADVEPTAARTMAMTTE